MRIDAEGLKGKKAINGDANLILADEMLAAFFFR